LALHIASRGYSYCLAPPLVPPFTCTPIMAVTNLPPDRGVPDSFALFANEWVSSQSDGFEISHVRFFVFTLTGDQRSPSLLWAFKIWTRNGARELFRSVRWRSSLVRWRSLLTRAARSAHAVPAAAKAGSSQDSYGTTEVVSFHVPGREPRGTNGDTNRLFVTKSERPSSRNPRSEESILSIGQCT
jgi:hypothetical protein